MSLLKNFLTLLTKARKSATDPAGGILEIMEERRKRKVAEFYDMLKAEAVRSDEDFSKYTSDLSPEDIADIFDCFANDRKQAKNAYYILFLKGIFRGLISGELKDHFLSLIQEFSAVQLNGVKQIYIDIPHKGSTAVEEISVQRKFFETLFRNKHPLTKHLVQTLINYGLFNDKDGTKPPWANPDFIILGQVLNDETPSSTEKKSH